MTDAGIVFLLHEETIEPIIELTGVTREFLEEAIDWDESVGVQKAYVLPVKTPEPWRTKVVAEVIHNVDKNIDELVVWADMSPEDAARSISDFAGRRHYFYIDITLTHSHI